MSARIFLYSSRNSRCFPYRQDSVVEVEEIQVTRGLLRRRYGKKLP